MINDHPSLKARHCHCHSQEEASPVSSPLYQLPFSVTTYRLVILATSSNQNETGRVYIMLRAARFPFHRLRRTGVYNPHFAGNAPSKQVRRDGRTMGLEKVNSRLTYSSQADVLQPAKTEMPPLAKAVASWIVHTITDDSKSPLQWNQYGSLWDGTSPHRAQKEPIPVSYPIRAASAPLLDNKRRQTHCQWKHGRQEPHSLSDRPQLLEVDTPPFVTWKLL